MVTLGQLWSLDNSGQDSFLLASLPEAIIPSKVFILRMMTWTQLSVGCDSMKGPEDQKMSVPAFTQNSTFCHLPPRSRGCVSRHWYLRCARVMGWLGVPTASSKAALDPH